MQEAAIRNMDSAYSSAVPHGVKGLYTSFQSAATILRIARTTGELKVPDGGETSLQEEAHLNAFFERLDRVERDFYRAQSHQIAASAASTPFVVVVEGLDGSGKTSLVRSLAQCLPYSGRAVRTPTESVSSVRFIFDRRGGAVARAFYMVSNYILQDEILNWHVKDDEDQQSMPVFVVDRWYASTVAYSVAWKNTTGSPQAIDELDESLFEWPRDLQPAPQLMLVLQVDDNVRRTRVHHRRQSHPQHAGNKHNPWDDRLDQDPDLGQRILRALQRVKGPQEMVLLNANQAQEQVLEDACRVVIPCIQRYYTPWEYYKTRPMDFFRFAAARNDLCDPNTGVRLRHQPWAIQLALPTKGAPSLRGVGVHSSDDSGILFFTWGHPGGGRGGDTTGLVSMLWAGGSYPVEQQWRAEGILCPTRMSECKLLKKLPPTSLLAQFEACRQQIVTSTSTTDGVARRPSPSADHAKRVVQIRSEQPPQDLEQECCGSRFVPLRMEVLIGGPGSPAGPRRWEWSRNNRSAGCRTAAFGWSEPREILPFSPPSSISSPAIRSQFRPITIALTGTHCAGKATVGRKLAEVLGYDFQPELGDVLRDADRISSGGHRLGDGTGAHNAMAWDDRVHEAEVQRDQSSLSSRVVETWHVGNLAWALMRMRGQPDSSPNDRKALFETAKGAIQDHEKNAVVLFVHLSISLEALHSRRKIPDNSKRIPMDNEEAECNELHEALETRGLELVNQLSSEMDIPALVLENSDGGEAEGEESAGQIVRFIQENSWRIAIA